MQQDFHGISHRGVFEHLHLCAGDHAHIEKMLPQGTFSADRGNNTAFADF